LAFKADAQGRVAKPYHQIHFYSCWEFTMSSNLETLQEEVFHLSPADRARLLDHLINRLDADDEAEAAWDSLAEKREREITSGAAEAMPVDGVIARLATRFPG
jgi:hypothetical protein